jgi:hypothetical protein
MKSLPKNPELLSVAQRVVWFKPPASALDDPIHFLAHVMTYGTAADLTAVFRVIGRAELCEVLDHAPPGVFDARSWAYWHLVCGRPQRPPLPKRRFD